MTRFQAFFARTFSPAPGRNMETRYPVTCVVELEELADSSNLKPGDTATVDVVTEETVLCRHVGIYLGHDEVIEFTNELRTSTLAAFTGGAQLYRVRYKTPEQTVDPDQTVTRARDALKQPEIVGSYDIISNNSEHFVTYCTFNKRLSYEGIRHVEREEAQTDIGCCWCSM